MLKVQDCWKNPAPQAGHILYIRYTIRYNPVFGESGSWQLTLPGRMQLSVSVG